jgi:phosphohistidine phosphatase
MKNLLLMRHGKSSWNDESLSDFERPLKKRGKRDVPIMAELLVKKDLIPQIILSSPSKRTRQTTKLANRIFELDKKNIHSIDNFYMANWHDFLPAIQQINDEINSIMIVGHNPSLELFLQSLTGEFRKMPTSAVAYIKIPITSWTEFDESLKSIELVKLWKPKKIREKNESK